MGKEETLHQIKAAEAAVRQAKQAAAEERERILRKAREEALGIVEAARKAAEERQAAIIAAAESETGRRKDAILAEGRRDAEALRREGEHNIDRAIEFVVEKFKGAWNA
jgi:vacuolar-type H+-ATPase subunit H